MNPSSGIAGGARLSDERLPAGRPLIRGRAWGGLWITVSDSLDAGSDTLNPLKRVSSQTDKGPVCRVDSPSAPSEHSPGSALRISSRVPRVDRVVLLSPCDPPLVAQP